MAWTTVVLALGLAALILGAILYESEFEIRMMKADPKAYWEHKRWLREQEEKNEESS